MMPCGLNDDPQRIIPVWKITKWNTNDTVISERGLWNTK